MDQKDKRPFEFPIAVPPKQNKTDESIISDVVKAECFPKEAENSCHKGNNQNR